MIRRSLSLKLILAFLLVAITSAALVAVLIRLTNAGRLNQLILEQQRSGLVDQVIGYYRAYGTLQGLDRYLQQIGPPPQDGPSRSTPAPQYPAPQRQPAVFGVTDAAGVVVLAMPGRYPLGTRVPPQVLAQGQPIVVDGRSVGTILSPPLPPNLSPEELAYLQRTNQALLLAAGGAVLVALVVGAALAGTLTRPLHALKRAAQSMASGALGQEVPVGSQDEIGELALAFNLMSREVARANDLRRQMTADVAHDLRTPLTVAAGYLEAMRDGVLPPTPERLSTVYAEIERLQRLVEDLRTLSRADAGELSLNRQAITPRTLLEQAAAAFAHRAAQQQVGLHVEVAGDVPAVYVDEARFMQVLGNLLVNALRYTPAGGRIRLRAARAGDRVILSVQDSGQGISPQDLPHVFQRFYRADTARGEGGESGLGLAIVQALVQAHRGSVRVDSAPGCGATFTVELPAVPSTGPLHF